MKNYYSNEQLKVFSDKSSITAIDYINKNGEVIDNDYDKVYAKIVHEDKKETFYVKTYDNAIFDPLGRLSNRENVLETKMKRVSKSTFDYYVMYLNTNNSIYLTKANRSFINE
jgi:hypothetical protein